MVAEPGHGAVQEGGGGGVAFVGQGFDVGQAGVVVDGDVQVVVADTAAADLLAAAVHPPTAAVRHSAEFLDVDVQQLARGAAFVADARMPPPHRHPGDRVDRRQRWYVPTTQDTTDGGGH
ncbi:hypothetical protein GCM10027445_68660 [Amycolatopsis endophytica]